MQQKWYFESPTRYYSVTIEKDLFNEWILTKHWGGKTNNINGYKSEVINNLDNIDQTIVDICAERRKRGYLLKENLATMRDD